MFGISLSSNTMDRLRKWFRKWYTKSDLILTKELNNPKRDNYAFQIKTETFSIRFIERILDIKKKIS